MAREKVEFRNKDGNTLSAVIEQPQGDPKGFALFAHCFTCTKNLSAVRRISRGLTDQSTGILSFDFSGLGESEGEFVTSGFAHQADDLVSGAGFLKKHIGKGPELLIGHSLGGTATLRRIPSVLGVSTIGSPADPAHVTKLFECDVEEIEQRGEADVGIGVMVTLGSYMQRRNNIGRTTVQVSPRGKVGVRSRTCSLRDPAPAPHQE